MMKGEFSTRVWALVQGATGTSVFRAVLTVALKNTK